MSQAIITKLYEIWTKLGDGTTKVQLDQTTPGTTNGVQLTGSAIAVPTDKQAIFRLQSFITTTAIGIGSIYTGASIDGIRYRRLTGKVFSDQAGTLTIQHSDNATTWDTLLTVSVATSTPEKFDEVLYAQYVRVVYTNGTTAQTAFRLSGYLSVE